MIIYNVTVNIEESVHDEWMEWMKEVHIPKVMHTGKFTSHRMFRIVGDEESGGKTYCIQYTCDNMNDFREYEKQFAQSLRAETLEKYKEKFVAFRTLLESVD